MEPGPCGLPVVALAQLAGIMAAFARTAMGTHFHTVVSPQASLAEAPAWGQRWIAWLQAEQIIRAERSDCVLGSHGGFAPGPHYRQALAEDDPAPGLLALSTHGVELITERSVFDAGGAGFGLRCAACRSAFEDIPDWGDAVSQWFSDEGPGTLACPACGAQAPVTQWEHVPPYAYGNLGLKFWNWPPLADAFVAALAQQVGHPVVVVSGTV